LEIIGFSIALQSFDPLSPGRLHPTGVHPVPNIGDESHPTLLLDSHAKGGSSMLLQRLPNDFNWRRVCGVCQCRNSANKEFPAAIISKVRSRLRSCRPSYTMLWGSTNLKGRRAAFVRIRHNICPRKKSAAKKKLLTRQSWFWRWSEIGWSRMRILKGAGKILRICIKLLPIIWEGWRNIGKICLVKASASTCGVPHLKGRLSWQVQKRAHRNSPTRDGEVRP
ncbi:hypothetical protein Taro_034598, partial [Colocasia esculenta]|nr:hypothetical protein [Colocasia esculenta]